MKLMQCKTCGAELAPSAKACPKCGAKNKKPIYKRPWFIVLVVLFVFALFSGGSDKPTSTGTSTGSSSASTSGVSERQTVFEQNEEVTFKGVTYAITNVDKTTGKKYDKAKDGKEYVIITLSIKNTSDETVSYNAWDWKMENSAGQIDGEAWFSADYETSLGSGNLKSGGFIEGTVVFEEPIGDEGLMLGYYNNMFDDDETFKFKIN